MEDEEFKHGRRRVVFKLYVLENVFTCQEQFERMF
jgi:hypothetical protein